MAKTQTYALTCALCEHRVEVTDPNGNEYTTMVRGMLAHLQEHGQPDNIKELLRVRSTAFMDGANGYAAQQKEWIIPKTETHGDITLVYFGWSQENVKQAAKGKRSR